MTITMSNLSNKLREQLVSQLLDKEAVYSPEWITALRSTPREAFVPAYWQFAGEDNEAVFTPSSPSTVSEDSWLKAIYSDESLITQIDNTAFADTANTTSRAGAPTSSSTLPSLVIWMLEELDVRDGDKVLEIGTGTGYSTALLSHRLGDENITSIEYDSEVASRAANALHSLDYHPHLVTGDGLAGAPENAPFDRIIATCSIRAISPQWFQQAKPGATILATLVGSMFANALAKLTVTSDGEAVGKILPGFTSFMPARGHIGSPLVHAERFDGRHTTQGSDITVEPSVLEDWTGRFVAQLAAPHAIHTIMTGESGDEVEYLTDERDDSLAVFTPSAESWKVHQEGPQRLWDKITTVITQWRAVGSPPMEKFQIEATPNSYTITIPGTNVRWNTFPVAGGDTGTVS